MELEFEKRGISYLKPLLRQVQAQEQTQELRLSDGMPDVGRVLGTWGQVILRGKEWRSDRVSCNGGIMAWVLYAPEDGTEPRMLESWIPFQMKWDLDDGYREGSLRIQLLLRSLDARLVSARKILVRANVSALGEAFREDTAQVPVPGEMPEDIQLLRSRYPLRFPKGAGEKTFSMDEELTLPTSSPDPKRLVSYCLEPRLTEVKVMSGKLVFRGSGVLHMVYLSDEGKLESRDVEIPIHQFAELEGTLSADAQGDIRMAITSLELDLDDENHLRLKAGLLAQYVLDDRELVEIVEDAYSPQRLVELQREELELPRILEQKAMSIPVRQTIRQESRDIADVTYLPDFPEVRRGEGASLELPGMFQVVYYDENGRLDSATARTLETVELPAGEDARLEATVLPAAPPTAAPGSGMELKGETLVQLQTTSRRPLTMVTGLQAGEAAQKDPSRPSLILRRAGDAGLWQIAKSTGSTVEAIKQANGLESEPQEDVILLVPVS